MKWWATISGVDIAGGAVATGAERGVAARSNHIVQRILPLTRGPAVGWLTDRQRTYLALEVAMAAGAIAAPRPPVSASMHMSHLGLPWQCLGALLLTAHFPVLSVPPLELNWAAPPPAPQVLA